MSHGCVLRVLIVIIVISNDISFQRPMAIICIHVCYTVPTGMYLVEKEIKNGKEETKQRFLLCQQTTVMSIDLATALQNCLHDEIDDK